MKGLLLLSLETLQLENWTAFTLRNGEVKLLAVLLCCCVAITVIAEIWQYATDFRSIPSLPVAHIWNIWNRSGQWSVASDQWPVASGQWPVVHRHLLIATVLVHCIVGSTASSGCTEYCKVYSSYLSNWTPFHTHTHTHTHTQYVHYLLFRFHTVGSPAPPVSPSLNMWAPRVVWPFYSPTVGLSFCLLTQAGIIFLLCHSY